MAERKVISRRRKKASKGKVIRVSDDVFNPLNRKRRRDKSSWDAFMRTAFNIPDRSGAQQDLIEKWTVPGIPMLFDTKPIAHAQAVLFAAEQGMGYVPIPIKMRQVP